MADLPPQGMAHKPGPDVNDDLPPPDRSELDRDELIERLEGAVHWMRLARIWVQDKSMRDNLDAVIEAFEQEGWR